MNNTDTVIKDVKTYYGSVLESTADLKTSACCTSSALPVHLRPLYDNIHQEVRNRFYGCGSPIPEVLEGLTLLDLGCGTGVDCYLASQLVGEKGKVIGIDMTPGQIEIARQYQEFHREKFGFKQSNVIFHQGYIENLEDLGIKDQSIDVVISNCVINLSANKEKVFSEIFRVLKPGGELYVSDVFSDRRIPSELQSDPVLLGECLGGAMYMEDFRRLLNRIGIYDYRLVSDDLIELQNEEIQKQVGMIGFHSMTIRAYKLDLEDICENYGHVAFYKGTIPNSPHRFQLDDHHVFDKGLPVPVCGNTAIMLTETSLSQHFTVMGDFSVHYGAFPCGSPDIVNEDRQLLGKCC